MVKQIKFEKDENGKSKVIMQYVSFIGTLLGIFSSIVAMLLYLNAIKLDIEVHNTNYDMRIIEIEKKVDKVEHNLNSQNDKIQNINIEIEKIKGKNAKNY